MKLFPRRRQILIVFAVLIAAALGFMIYLLNLLNNDELLTHGYKNDLDSLKKKIDVLEDKAAGNAKDLQHLENVYKGIDNSQNKGPQVPQPPDNKQKYNNINHKPAGGPHEDKELKFLINYFQSHPAKVFAKQCDWFSDHRAADSLSDLKVADWIESLPFDDIDGGVWKQGFDITYNPSEWNENKKLQVIIVPHSHNDPGWLMTFEQYFNQRTRGILDTVVNSLSEKSTRKFVWAETSYLSLWWQQASPAMKEKMRKLIIDTKQLEIVTGGWVMTDEANSHYYAMIEQMIEGHEWLKANVDPSLRPHYGWSIDPFGYSPTMAYLLKQMGFDGMLIQRVHYHLKKHMARVRDFEFKWRQSWSSVNSKDTSIMTHVMPFYSYDIPHTCGPDPKVCCQFDFKRMGTGITCPWGVPPQTISETNVKSRAELLLDQYRKKSQLYGDEGKHNVLLVTLGDDFRYTDMSEAHAQFENYERLMEYMNADKNMNVNVRWGTLGDYFQLMKENNEAISKKPHTFSGDFFTYADRNDHYWSGYFTSRAFSKRLDRIVEHYLRSAEIMFSLSNLFSLKTKADFVGKNDLYKKLLVVRRNLALFQHHDGITGTSKTPVVEDYTQKLYVALANSREIIEQSVSFMMNKESKSSKVVFNIDDIRLNPDENSAKKQNRVEKIELNDQTPEQKIVILNSNLYKRQEVVSIRVNTPHVQVFVKDHVKVKNVQVNLIWSNTDGGYLKDYLNSGNKIKNMDDYSFASDFDQQFYEVLFEASLDALSLTTFTIRKKAADQSSNSTSSSIITDLTKVVYYYKTLNDDSNKLLKEKLSSQKIKTNTIVVKQRPESEIDVTNYGTQIRLATGTDYDAYFSPHTGFLLHYLSSTRDLVRCSIKLIKYGTTSGREKSGAYLFLPDGPAKDVDPGQVMWVRVEKGQLRSRVCTQYQVALHCVEIFPTMNQAKGFKIPMASVWNVVDLRQSHNYELAMLVQTGIKNEDIIHTDLNGFQYTKRKRYAKLTIQGNVYPMPSGAYIQDSNLRLNLLTAQPLGVGSLDPSNIQVFLDRRLDQDDNRGMEQAMNDNVLVSNRFILYFEAITSKTSSLDKIESSISTDFPSLMATWLSQELLYPIIKLNLVTPSSSNESAILVERKFASSSFPCDLHLVNMRTMQSKNEEPLQNELGLILHRAPYEDCPASPYVQLPGFVHTQCGDNNQFRFQDFFGYLNPDFEQDQVSLLDKLSIRRTLLTLNNQSSLEKLGKTDYVLRSIQPMHIEAFRLTF